MFEVGDRVIYRKKPYIITYRWVAKDGERLYDLAEDGAITTGGVRVPKLRRVEERLLGNA